MHTFERNRLYRYRSPMGAVGVGFLIEFAGRAQHSVAWPDGPARRYKNDELQELGIKCYEAEPAHESLEPNESQQTEAVGPAADEGTVEDDTPQFAFKPDDTEANNIREYLRTFPEAENQQVIAALNKLGMQVSSSQVSAAKKQLAKLAEKEASAATDGAPAVDSEAMTEEAQS